ncbi:DNA breaking-rejoining protein [Sphingomonas cavernae]|nr:DNA breaking-rejoining protein [Sphingomonas cavernae]
MKHIAAICAAAMLAATPVVAQDATRTTRVEFAKGATSKAITGSVKGYDTAIYVIGARAGQTMTVTLKTSNASNYFTVMAPAADEALFDGTINGNSFKGKLPASGDYQVRVFLMRNAARRNEVGKYTLTFGIK